MVNGSSTFLIAACGLAALGITIAVPLSLPQQQPLDKNPIAQTPATSPTDDAPSLSGLDVNLHRPLIDPAADPTANPSTNYVLLGTSIDSARPMALVQMPDGTSRWLSLNETTSDGFQLTRVDHRSATIVQQGHPTDLSLPGATP